MKIITLSFYIIGLLSLIPMTSQAQYRAFEWDAHGVGFEVASDFLVMKNNYNEFTAVSSDNQIAISIQPWQDASITINNLEQATVNVGADLLTGGNELIAADYIQLDYYQGYYIVVSTPGSQYSGDFMLLALLLDTESGTNLTISISGYNANFDEVFEMLFSVYAYD